MLACLGPIWLSLSFSSYLSFFQTYFYTIWSRYLLIYLAFMRCCFLFYYWKTFYILWQPFVSLLRIRDYVFLSRVASGFFTKIVIKGEERTVIATNNHVIASAEDAKNATAKFFFEAYKNPFETKLRPDFFFSTDKVFCCFVGSISTHNYSQLLCYFAVTTYYIL